jgi:hypothetical protein
MMAPTTTTAAIVQPSSTRSSTPIRTSVATNASVLLTRPTMLDDASCSRPVSEVNRAVPASRGHAADAGRLNPYATG